MSEENLKLNCLQTRLLEMLKWFHNFCVEHELNYYALGGTMLGAVRHGGFIPWDDDIDIGLPRKDYERFIELMEDSKHPEYELETPNSSAKEYTYCYAKLYDLQTTLIENRKHNIKRGIFLDIFPLDGMGNSEEEAKQYFLTLDRKFKFFLARTTGVRKGRKFFKNAAVVISRLIPEFLVDDKKLLSNLDMLAAQKDFYKCSYGGNAFGAWRFKEIMPREIMGKPRIYPFEDTVIYGAENADAYLTHLYGNWRQLPPLEKRVSHHDFLLLDLDTPYK